MSAFEGKADMIAISRRHRPLPIPRRRNQRADERSGPGVMTMRRGRPATLPEEGERRISKNRRSPGGERVCRPHRLTVLFDANAPLTVLATRSGHSHCQPAYVRRDGASFALVDRG